MEKQERVSVMRLAVTLCVLSNAGAMRSADDDWSLSRHKLRLHFGDAAPFVDLFRIVVLGVKP